MKITSKSRTIKFFLKSENTILFHFFFKCTFFFTKYRRSVLCFVVNVGFFFTFSLLIFLHDYRIFQQYLKQILISHFFIICFVACQQRIESYENSNTKKLFAYHDWIKMMADRSYFSFCHNLKHFLRKCIFY